MTYNPYNWYWLADDGRIFSSATQTLVTDTDPAYVAFVAGHPPTPWPRDDQTNQTDKALQDVLAPYETIFVNDEYYAQSQLQDAVNGGMTVSGIASAPSGLPTMTEQYNRTEINIAYITAEHNVSYTATWVGADGNFYPLNNTDVVKLGQALSAHMNSCYDAYISAVNLVRTKSMKSRKEIDVLFGKQRIEKYGALTASLSKGD